MISEKVFLSKRVLAHRTLKRVCGDRPEEGTALTLSLMSMSTFSCKWSLDRTLAIGPRTKSFFEKAPTLKTEQNCQIHLAGSTYKQSNEFFLKRLEAYAIPVQKEGIEVTVLSEFKLYYIVGLVEDFDWNSFYTFIFISSQPDPQWFFQTCWNIASKKWEFVTETRMDHVHKVPPMDRLSLAFIQGSP